MVLPIWALTLRITSFRNKPLVNLNKSLALASMTSSLCSSVAAERARPSSSGIVYTAVESPLHRLTGHVEAPERISSALKSLTAAALIGPKAAPRYIDMVRELRSPRVAGMDDVALVHGYAESLRSKCSAAKPSAPVVVADLGDPDGVTYVTQSSFQDALVALGASLNIVDAVLSVSHSSPPVGFALVRPPGHHATADTPLGFCLFNNIAIAAKYAQKHHDIRRVLIVDFDVHNGNGTCETFWEDDSVLVIDVHEESTVYPSPEFIPSQEKDIGSGRGSGYTINVPFPRYAGHESVVMLWEQIVIPAARRFQPQAIMVSAGYDGHVMDPFQLLQYEDRTYHYMASTLKTLADELCRGRLMFFLEGGYDLTALGSAVTETWRAVLGERPGEKTVGHTSVIPEKEPVQDVRSLVRRLQDIHGL